MEYQTSRCEFTSPDLKDIEFIRSLYYNKKEYLRFDSRVGEFVGYTEFGVMNANRFNKDSSELAAMKAQKEAYCLTNVEIDYQNALSKSVEPTVRLYSTTPPAGSHPAMLVCRVYNFYPKQIKVSWLRDGREVTSDVTTTDEMENGDWYYQVHSTLEYTPSAVGSCSCRSGEKISCRVEHASLKEPLITDWSPSMPESQKNKLAIGASGLILGLILSLAGFIYYKRKARGQTSSIPVQTRFNPVWRCSPPV
ncbi:hypothetical protein XENOCAPTIV_004932 [Xenoophorus captivus]|uniref:Ig-like domain-containing protein n=1 Tax=Xenoophorus captivus TaxID=1517983 RepID=A0ABV0QZU3_9TELE